MGPRFANGSSQGDSQLREVSSTVDETKDLDVIQTDAINDDPRAVRYGTNVSVTKIVAHSMRPREDSCGPLNHVLKFEEKLAR